MLGLAEYTELKVEIEQLGKEIERRTAEKVAKNVTKQEAIQIAQKLSMEYQERYEQLLFAGLTNISRNAAIYYTNLLDINPADFDDIVDSIVLAQYKEPFFGATLTQRLAVNSKKLQRKIVQTAQLGTNKLSEVYTKSVPFGAHATIDKRVALGYAVKIENEMSKQMAQLADIPLIKWTLSGRHSQEDVCDDLANYIDPKVVRYLEYNNNKMNPKGLYFRDELPGPPHPNCQCEFGMVSQKEGKVKRSRVKRAAKTIRRILKRLAGK